MPQAGISPKQTPPPRGDAKREPTNAALTAGEPKQAPPPPGMGKLLDKTV